MKSGLRGEQMVNHRYIYVRLCSIVDENLCVLDMKLPVLFNSTITL